MKKSIKLDYKWVIVTLCFLMIFTTLGFCSSNASIYTFAITETLGISRSAYSLVNSFRFITNAIINLFFGTLLSKFGPKKMVCGGFLSLIIATSIFSVASNVYVFYIGGCFLGIGMSWVGTTMVSSIINRWCTENKGTIMGVVLSANGLGGALAAQIVTPLIYDETNPFGYRNAYRLVVLILLIVAVFVVSFMKDKPRNYNYATATVHKKKSRGKDWIGIDFKTLKKSPLFYMVLACIFFTGFILHGINGVAAVHMKDVGLSAGYIATVLSVHSLVLTLFKFLTGFIYDKFGLRVTMWVCSLAAIVSMTSLALLTNSFAGKIFAMIYGVLSSLALPLETIMLPIYTGDLFGQMSYDKILGIIVSLNVMGYAVGGPVTNIVFDITGTYMPALIGSAILMVCVLVTMNFVINSANRIKKSVIEEYEKKKGVNV